MATKTQKKSAPPISANLQWAILIGVAALAIAAVFIFGIGTSTTGGGHSGAPASVAILSS